MVRGGERPCLFLNEWKAEGSSSPTAQCEVRHSPRTSQHSCSSVWLTVVVPDPRPTSPLISHESHIFKHGVNYQKGILHKSNYHEVTEQDLEMSLHVTLQYPKVEFKSPSEVMQYSALLSEISEKAECSNKEILKYNILPCHPWLLF